MFTREVTGPPRQAGLVFSKLPIARESTKQVFCDDLPVIFFDPKYFLAESTYFTLGHRKKDAVNRTQPPNSPITSFSRLLSRLVLLK
jgi:hypothetical protein